MTTFSCRFCDTPLHHVVADLGSSPLSNSYLKPEQLQQAEPIYPLCAYLCEQCLLVQLPEFEKPEAIFSDYAYFSSFSDSWLDHARRYVEMMIERFGISERHHVVEIASNDGYLLRFFKERGVPVLGIEPAANVAEAARELGIETRVEFFGTENARALAAEGRQADLLLGNNVLAHTPRLNDFVAGLAIALAERGIVTMEFPHLVRLIAENQFDTIYHEHFSYFSFLAVDRVFSAHGLRIFDVEELPTHGGSLRVFARHESDDSRQVSERVRELEAREKALRLEGLDYYRDFGEQIRETKRKLLDFLIAAKRAGKRIAGYGAPAKGNTLLNYCGVRTDFLDYTVDRSPHKQGCYLPGTRIPIHAPDHIRDTRPDYLLILPWNLREEIMEQMADVRDWGCELVVAIPEVTVLS
ncbi:MAG: class I SAM-dependent methyltransferase [bacterium]|nr:class I SAM-dependent methyltransferase [bacterium]